MYKILSVGGSIIIPPGGFDIAFLKKFRALILSRVKAGERFILVVGGGATCRAYQQAAKTVAGLSDYSLDWLGIKTTVVNAEFIRSIFGQAAHPEVITNPTKKIKTSKSIILAAGWKPGCSTDYDAALLAKTYGAREVINLSNVDYIYSSDPRQNPRAKKLAKISWLKFRQLVGSRWRPGANVPFDPTAARLAAKLKLTVKFVKGTALAQVARALAGQSFAGSVIAG